jgi:Peptidase A4 family
MKVTKSWITAVTAAAAALAMVSLAGPANAASRPVNVTSRLVTNGTLRPAIHLSRRSSANPQGIPIDYSGNWSGYVALPESGSGKAKSFKYVSASYSVPSVNCSVTNYAFSYHWVGLDGWTDSTVEQDGVGSFCVSGTPDYFAWYEMYPAGISEEFTVNPGDAITSSVTYAGGGDYILALTDQTSGQSFSVEEACSATCDNSSAEVITEGYTSSPYNGTADFGEEHYDTAQVEGASGTLGGLTSTHWSTIESIALGAVTGDSDTEPGPLFKATKESAFPITWYEED